MNSLKSKLWLKITSIILFVVFAVVFAASVAAVIFLGYSNVYFDGGKDLRSNAQDDYAHAAMYSISGLYELHTAPEIYGLTKEYSYGGDIWTYNSDIGLYEKIASGISFDSSKHPYDEPEKYFANDMIEEFFSENYTKNDTDYAFEIRDTESGELVLSNFAPPSDYVDTISRNFKASTLCDLQKVNLQFETRYELNRYLESLNGGLYNSEIYYIPTEKFVSETQTPSERVWVVEGDYIPIEDRTYSIILYIPATYHIQNDCQLVMNLVDFAIEYRYLPIITGVASAILLVVIFIYLMCAAGNKAGVEGITPNWIDKIPFDLYLVLLVAIIGVVFALSDFFWNGDLILFIYWVCAGIFFVILALSLLMTLATRAKLGTVLTNTVIWMAVLFLVKILKAIWRFIKKLCNGIGYMFKNIKYSWKASLILAAVVIFELVTFIMAVTFIDEFMIFVWLVGNAFLLVTAIFTIIAFGKIKKGASELASGNAQAKVDEQYLFGPFKECADDLNGIGEGIQRAVEESMKSERLKTELITNVSHDLKTPLTSIVNYIDILSKEDIQPEEAKEHVEVLVRQSQRMKKLIDDLIEASKASSGSTKVELARSDLSMLLSQSVIEYEERFKNADLNVKLTLPEKPLVASLDGKLMWRVFDNLLGNICKYTQSGTRVYITAVEKGDNIVVSFKNISKFELNISSDELMERFVRGDSSRSTEGSGLGLSIARSLCNLQNAVLDIDIDGDLFKVNITVKKLGDEDIINA